MDASTFGTLQEASQFRHRRGWKAHAKWESFLCKTIGLDWRDQAENQTSWKNNRWEFVYKALEQLTLGGARLARSYNARRSKTARAEHEHAATVLRDDALL